MPAFIRPEDILQATNGGLEIIISLYPDAAKSADKPGRKFKIREEKTASASLKKIFDQEKGLDVYLVTDFGNDGQPRNGINCYALEKRIKWEDALRELAARYQVGGEEVKIETNEAKYTGRDALPEEQENTWSFEIKDGFSDIEIETLFSKNVLRFVGWNKGETHKKEAYSRLRGVLQKYHFWPLKSYTRIKNRKAHTFEATETYPMFTIEEKHNDKIFRKIYQPLHSDKGRRFMYEGEKPKSFIHGLQQAENEYKKREEAALEDDETYDSADDDTKAQKRKAEKLEQLIIASGGSDALNLAALGYWVCWMNSETAALEAWDFARMTKIAKKVMQLQDIDDTGVASAHNLALQYLDLYTIELPMELRTRRDRRGNPCKDLRDYLNIWDKYDLDKLEKNALPYRFWEMQPDYQGRGENKVRVGWKYDFDNVQAYNFLHKNGFFRMAMEGLKTDYVFIHIDGNIVRQKKPNHVKNYMHRFLIERGVEKDLRNMLYRSTQLNESSLSNLDEREVNFEDSDESRQFLFFSHCTWEVTREGIKQHKPGAVKAYVWEDDVLDNDSRVGVLDEPFRIFKNNAGQLDIEIKDNSCLYLRLLIQTSRMHWRRELEEELPKLPPAEQEAYRKKHQFDIAGPLLTLEEQMEQKLHLINKIFAIGYLLHHYKDPSRAWAVVALDGKINDDGRSHGGSGKSTVLNKGISQILKKKFVIAGTSPKKTDDPHIFDGLTPHHRICIIDDADRNLSFRFFFEFITSDQQVNPKSKTPYVLKFEDVPKLIWLTNFSMITDPSTERRILYSVFSDYYHQKGDGSEYAETREPKDELGKNLWKQFTPEEWNLFYNTMARCLQLYLSTYEKVAPPMASVEKRNMQGEMGENFETWANVYFGSQSGNLDKYVVREEAFSDFESTYRSNKWSPQRFLRAMKAFCKYNGYELNPMELRNDPKKGEKKRIIHNVRVLKLTRDGWQDTNSEKSQELLYVRTDFDKPLNTVLPGKESADKLPF